GCDGASVCKQVRPRRAFCAQVGGGRQNRRRRRTPDDVGDGGENVEGCTAGQAARKQQVLSSHGRASIGARSDEAAWKNSRTLKPSAPARRLPGRVWMALLYP